MDTKNCDYKHFNIFMNIFTRHEPSDKLNKYAKDGYILKQTVNVKTFNGCTEHITYIMEKCVQNEVDSE